MRRQWVLGWLATGGWTREREPNGRSTVHYLAVLAGPPWASKADFPRIIGRGTRATVVTEQREWLLMYFGDNFATVEGAKKAGAEPDRCQENRPQASRRARVGGRLAGHAKPQRPGLMACVCMDQVTWVWAWAWVWAGLTGDDCMHGFLFFVVVGSRQRGSRSGKADKTRP